MIVKRNLERRGKCEVHQRQKDPLVRQLLTDVSRSLTALVARSKQSTDGENTGYLSILYLLEQPVLLNVYSELGDDDKASARQGPILDD